METIQMSQGECRRLEIFSQMKQGKMTLVQVRDLLGLSYRQVKRLWAQYQAEGDQGLVHGLRGRPSNHQSESLLRERVLGRYAESYADYGPTLAVECLTAEGLPVAVETLRRWLLSAGLWARQRRSKLHRRRRTRKEQYGELVQMDGSHHDWFEGRRAWAVLMVMIDDATGRIYARFFEEETLSAAFEMLQRYAAGPGLPRALYVDRAAIYRSDREPTQAELIAGIEPQTQFGRAMESLDVRLILAHSPQAKGRVERVNRTLQDRLVKALRQRGISDLGSANEFLETEYLATFNAQFEVPPVKAADLHRAAPAGMDLPRILAVHEDRVVQNDWTVRWQNAFLQLSRTCGLQPKAQVTVCAQLDGQVRLFAGERELPWSPTRSEPLRRPPPRPRRSGPTGTIQDRKPSAKHPWRRAAVTS